MSFAEIESEYGIELDAHPNTFYCDHCEEYHDEDAFGDVDATPLICLRAQEDLSPKPFRPLSLAEFKARGGCTILLQPPTNKSLRVA